MTLPGTASPDMVRRSRRESLGAQKVAHLVKEIPVRRLLLYSIFQSNSPIYLTDLCVKNTEEPELSSNSLPSPMLTSTGKDQAQKKVVLPTAAPTVPTAGTSNAAEHPHEGLSHAHAPNRVEFDDIIRVRNASVSFIYINQFNTINCSKPD